jgi:FKBP-type peptidyl-prolyl cis-trans isomerase SlpA
MTTLPTSAMNTLNASLNKPSQPKPQVKADSFLTLHYRITLIKAGELIGDFLSTFDEKPATLLMGAGQLSPALEAVLMGLPQGTHTTLELSENQAFGEHNPELIQNVSMALLKAEAEVGAQFEAGDIIEFNTQQGRMAGTVVSVDELAAVIDFNHPLAGQAVAFEVQLISVL